MNGTSPVDARAPWHDPGRRAWLGSMLVLLLVCAGSAAGLWHWPHDSPLLSSDARLRLDPNRATRTEFMLLPNIGPRLSARIVAYRRDAAARPVFATADDLANVRGIGPATVNSLRPYLRFKPDVSCTEEATP